MVDDLNTTAAEPEADSAAGTSWLRSKQGKLVLAGVGGLVVLVAIAALVFVLFFSSSMGGGEDSGVGTPGGASNVATSTVASEPVDPAVPELDETFTFRNIFKPSVKAPPEPTAASDETSGSSDSTLTAGEDELVLASIQVTEGVETATFLWNGSYYTLEEGEALGDTPWKLVSIGSDSVTVIYGDSSPIELSVGTSVGK